jgi:hypothetical protein
MAFGFGNTVNPQLGATDYSGYLQGALSGAQMQAQGGAAIGQGISQGVQAFTQGIERYQKKKEEKELREKAIDVAADTIKRAPDLFPRLDPNNREMLGAGVDTLGAEAFLRMEQMMTKLQEDQAANAYAAQLDQGKGMDYLRKGNFMFPFRSAPVSETARRKGEDLSLERRLRNAQLADLEATTQERLTPKRADIDRANDRLVSEVTDELVSQINAGIPVSGLAPGARGANEPQVTDSIFNRARNNPAVREALEKKELRDGEDAIASGIDSVRGGGSLDQAIANVPVRFRSAFISKIREQLPERTEARAMAINGKTIGHIVGSQFFPVTTPAMDPDSFTSAYNGMKDIALMFKGKEYDALPSDKRQTFDRLALQHAAATGLQSLSNPYDYITELYDVAQDIAGAVQDSVSSTNQQGAPVVPARAQPTGQPGVPPAGQPGARVAGGGGSPFINPSTQPGQPPLTVTMVTPISDVGPVRDGVTDRVIGAIGPRLEPTPASGVFKSGNTLPPLPNPQTPTPSAQPSAQGDGFFSAEKVAAYGTAPAMAAVKYRAQLGAAAKALGTFGKKASVKVAELGRATARRATLPLAAAAFANEAIGDIITLAANKAAKKSGSDLEEYNRSAINWLEESLAQSIYGPDQRQEVISKILDEYDGIKQAKNLTPEERRKANTFLFELLNKVRSRDDLDVPERFKATGPSSGLLGILGRSPAPPVMQAGMMY